MKMESEWHQHGAETEDGMMSGDSLTGGASYGEARPAYGQIGSDAMAKEIRSWAKWLLGFGIFNLVLSAYSGGFGVLLIIVGLACLAVQVEAMFVIIAVTFAWAAVSNLLSIILGQYSGIIWAIIQTWLVIRTFRQYGDYRQRERERRLDGAPLTGSDKMAQLFPLGGCLLSLLAVPGIIVVFFLVGMMMELNGLAEPPGLLIFAYDVLVNLGILSIAMGVASLLSGYRYKLLSIMGVLVGSLIAMAHVYLVFSG